MAAIPLRFTDVFSSKKPKYILAVILIAVLALAVRLPGLGQFMTVDEETWILRSSEFYEKLLAGDPAGTFITTHPGTPLMWLAGAGVQLRERQLGTGVDTSNIQEFRMYALLPVVIATSLLLGIIGALLMRLFGQLSGGIGTTLLVLDPYLLGLTQIVHVDALLALCMLGGFLCFLVAIFKSKRDNVPILIAVGIFTGLALSTKLLAALWLPVGFAGLLFIRTLPRPWNTWRYCLRTLGIIVTTASLVFVALWPAAWAKTDNLDQYIARDAATVATDEHVAIAISDEPIAPASFYGRTVLGRVTPIHQVFAIAVSIGAVIYAWRTKSISALFWMLMYGVGFLILITFIAKKSDRYALPALVVFPVLTGWGIAWVVTFAQRRWPLMVRNPQTFLGAILGGVILLQVAGLSAWHPYPIAYNNPLFPNVRSLTQQGWGEGLDAAARWLNEHPLGDKLFVSSWYPSVFAAYFDGKTMSLSSRDDHRVSFLVAYRNMGGRAPDDIASNVLDELKGKQPVHTIEIRGIPYVWIYEANTLGLYYRHVGEIINTVEVGQIIPIAIDNWNVIEIGMATYSDRNNMHDVRLEIYEHIDDEDPIRIATVNAADIENESWQAFEFEPIQNSSGRTYYVAVRSPSSVPGNAVTVRYVDADLAAGEMVFFREALKAGQTKSMFRRPGDIAYRLPQAK